MDKTIWEKWNDVHSEPDQVKRLDSAKKADLTPVSVNTEDGTARFKSKRGEYVVSLDSCTCADFAMRGLPCKHMYRLALELGLVSGEYASYVHGGYTWKQAVEIIEEHPVELQQYFYNNCFYKAMRKKEPFRIKKAPELDLLIQYGFVVEYPEKETPCYKTITVIEDFFVNKQKVHYYFSRKFRPKTYFLDGIEYEQEPLPEDDVTAFLRERGFVE